MATYHLDLWRSGFEVTVEDASGPHAPGHVAADVAAVPSAGAGVPVAPAEDPAVELDLSTLLANIFDAADEVCRVLGEVLKWLWSGLEGRGGM